MNLGDRIKQLRLEKNISQKDLAKHFNIARSTLSQYESNLRSPSDEMKLKISEYFNVSLDYLLGKTDKKNFDKNNVTDKINETIKNNKLQTIAAHYDDDDFTDSDLEDIKNFIDFVVSKKKK